MSEKRKDHKGRILRTGESRRKDLIYQYRYTDIRGKRQTVYSSDTSVRGVVKPAFQMACNEAIIRKNPSTSNWWRSFPMTRRSGSP